MKVHARFGEILSKSLKDLKETKSYGRMNGRKDGQRENSIPPPPQTQFAGGINNGCTI